MIFSIPSQQWFLNITRALFLVLIEAAAGMIRLIGILTEAISPFLALIGYVSSQDLLLVFPAWRFRFAFWATVLAIAMLVLGTQVSGNLRRTVSSSRVLTGGLLLLLLALVLSHLYVGVYGQFIEFVETTPRSGTSLEWSMSGWSLVLFLLFGGTYSSISFGLAFIGLVAYEDAIAKTKSPLP